MADPRSTSDEDEPEESGAAGDRDGPAGADDADEERRGGDEALSTEELRRRVEEEYDLENFGPEEMARMSREEWEAVFDPETWITGEELLDRVEADLKDRVARRDVFARVERLATPDRLVAYSDEGYAVVYPDGAVEGRGTVRRDVEPSVALCSMEGYEVPEAPDGELLPDPVDVPEGSGEFGNLMVQVIAAAQALAGLGLLGAWLFTDAGIIPLVVGLGFLFISVLLFVVVANARLSDKFRAEEYRNRLRAVGVESGELPEFLADEGRPAALDRVEEADAAAADGERRDGESDGPGEGARGPR